MKRSQGPQPPSRRFMAEIAVTVVFWGVWIYFILPLISVILWYAGVSLFVEEMFVRGGIDAFIEKLRAYGLVVLLMMASLMFWTQWNVRRYGGVRNTRTKPRPDVALAETSEMSGISIEEFDRLHRARRAVVDYDDHDRLRIVETEPLRDSAKPRKTSRSRRRKPPV